MEVTDTSLKPDYADYMEWRERELLPLAGGSAAGRETVAMIDEWTFKAWKAAWNTRHTDTQDLKKIAREITKSVIGLYGRAPFNDPRDGAFMQSRIETILTRYFGEKA